MSGAAIQGVDMVEWREHCCIAMNRALEEMGLSVAAEKRDKLLDYAQLLHEGNRRMNLTALDRPEDVAQKHLADSLLPLCFDAIPQGASLVDVGTGAGLPGLPLLILRPDIRLLLLDALEKRLGFLRECCQQLGLAAETLHARAEDASRLPEYRDAFDVATSRAVAAASMLMELALPLVKPGGRLLAYKGNQAREELIHSEGALKALNASLLATEEREFSWGMRALVILGKDGPTPEKYPRRAAKMRKMPL